MRAEEAGGAGGAGEAEEARGAMTSFRVLVMLERCTGCLSSDLLTGNLKPPDLFEKADAKH
ncbi:MAG: hypothetical protein ACAF41_20420 [Leptolyngbya sp. BL-A-14]